MRTNTKSRNRTGRIVSAAKVVEPLEPRQLLSTYYVSNGGSDAATGDAMTAAWKTVNRVNSQKLKPGDTVLFAIGQTFSGTISVPSTESGTKTAPITFASYGSGNGRATIRSGNNAGIDIANAGGVVINNLNFAGAGMSLNTAVGIYVHSDVTNKAFSTLNIKNVDVNGYGKEGMRILVAGAGSSFSDVKVEYANFHDNLYGGLKVTGPAHNVNKNYLINHVNAWGGPGSKTGGGVTGSGIYLA